MRNCFQYPLEGHSELSIDQALLNPFYHYIKMKAYMRGWGRDTYPSAVGSVSDCKARGRLFKPRSGHILSLRFDHENNFYDHSLPITDSRRAVVSYWRKNGH